MNHRALAATFMFSMTILLTAGASTSQAIELLHWTFDQVDTVDDVVFTTPDSSGRGNTGTLTSMDNNSPVPGRVGNALQFSGTNTTAPRDRVQIATPPPSPDPVITDFNRTYTQFTFAAFVKPIGISEDESDTTFIAGKMGNSSNRGWQIGLTGLDLQTLPPENRHPDDVIISLFDGPSGVSANDNEIYSGPAGDPAPPDPTALPNDVWSHVAFTFSGIGEASSFMRIYIDGVRVTDSITELALMNGINGQPFQVGNRGDQRIDSWQGLIDDVYVFDHALTDEEILALIPPEVPATPGDFNDDGLVDAADYVVFRKNLDGVTPLPNDDGLGTPIGTAHYNLFVANFGEPGGSGAGASSAAAPEPTSLLLMIAGAAMVFSQCRRTRLAMSER